MSKLLKNIRTYYQLYILSLPGLVYIIVFHYIPMAGVQLAFKDFRSRLGIWGSPWVGFDHFKRFFLSYNFSTLLSNTLTISFLSTAIMFPLPIIFALMLNETRNRPFKKTVQMAAYAPHFISTVVIVGMLNVFFSSNTGIVNRMIMLLGGNKISFFAEPSWFRPLYIGSGVWQNIGYSSIIYMAALAAVDVELYESAQIDGATKMQKIIHIDIPSILPTIIILLIMNLGRIMQVGFEKIYLMQNDLNMSVSDVLSTYIYRLGVQNGDFSFTTAVGLFNNGINLILLITVNTISRRLTETSLW